MANRERKPVKRPVLGGREQVKVAIVQISPAFLDKAGCVARAEKAIQQAGENGADLVVFPEVWMAGYPYWTEGWDTNVPDWIQGRVRFHDAAVLIPGEETEAVGEAAKKAGVYVVMGVNEMDPRPEARTVYNSLVFIGKDGQVLGRHRKLIPTFTERMFWGNGDGRDIIVFDTDIGRIGGLICGENLMTLLRGAMISEGEDIHVAVFPGSFVLHTGPQLEEPDTEGLFWGHSATRAHAMEAGAFVVSACGYQNAADIPDDFPYKGRMNIAYAHGGSQVVSPLAFPMTGPVLGEQIVYCELQAVMLKAVKAIMDTMGHYARPDVLKLLIRRDNDWQEAGSPREGGSQPPKFSRDELRRQADRYEISEEYVEEVADRAGLAGH